MPTLDQSGQMATMLRMAPKIDPDLYVTIGTAARLANVGRFWMRQLVQKGTVAGISIDGQWFALKSSVEAYAKTPAGLGRPRGGKHGN